jgi:hypothetical protein
MVSSTEGWAVGAGGVIVHGLGSSMTWSAFTSPTANNLLGVSQVSSSLVFAVGAAATFIEYTSVYSPSGTFVSTVLDGGSPSTAWAVIFWTRLLPQSTTLTVATRTGNTASPDGTWSAFSAELSDQSGSTIASPAGRYLQYRLTFSTSDPVATPTLADISALFGQPTLADIKGVDGVSPNDVWAVGPSGTVIHWNGSNWSSSSSSTVRTLKGIDMVTSTNGFAVGAAGAIIKWNGTIWSSVTSPTTSQLNGISLDSATDGFAVGGGGTIIKWDGANWTLYNSSPTTNDLNGVYMVSATSGWAVGASGKILRWNGTNWSTATSPTASNLNGIWMVSDSVGWAVGDGGTIIRWDGSSWSTVTSPTVSVLHAVYLLTSLNGWAVGDGGTLIKWDGTSWTSYNSPTRNDLWDVILTSATPHDGWAVGSLGKILRDPSPPYVSSGTFLSSVLDTDSGNAAWDLYYFTSVLPANTTLTVAVRSGNAATPDGTWSAFSSESSTSGGTVITVPAARYFQYRASLSTIDTNVTPALDKIIVTYSK